jgi:CheY-like chemotaxis protein
VPIAPREVFLSGKTLLFADDSATMRIVMEKTFHAEDFDVVTVPSGQAAIEKAGELIPDIIIADAGMAGISGYDVCRAVRDDAALSEIPVIIMSGISNPYDEAKGNEAGATLHVKKPFDTTRLIESVNELCKADSRPAAAVPPPAPSATGSGVSPVKPERPSMTSSFARPAAAPPKPAAPLPLEKAVPPENPRATADFKMPRPVKEEPVIKDPDPIELDSSDDHGHIQVGTLAELAQMNDKGGTIPQEVRHDAIELDGVPAPPVPAAPVEEITEEIVPESPEPEIESVPEEAAPAAINTALKAVSREAAKQVAAGVDGLNDEQAAAILALTEDVIEKVVWEVVPDLAETIIREKLELLLKE